MMEYVIDTIRTEGPKMARDFESKKDTSGSWWNWKPAKLALERLFMQGDLMINNFKTNYPSQKRRYLEKEREFSFTIPG